MSAALRPHLPLLASVGLLAGLLLAAMHGQNNLLFWAAGVLGAAIILSAGYATLCMRAIEVKRLDPKHGLVGEPLVIQYAVTNRSRFLPAFNVTVEDLPPRGTSRDRHFSNRARAWIMHIGPGETVHGEAVLWPAARGEASFERLRAWTTFPFGILRRTRTMSQPAHTLIYPRRYVLKRGVLESIIPSGPLGMKLSNRPGGGDDYFGLREYKPGDGRRQIAWKRSAGGEALIVKERTLPSPPRLRIVLNLTVPTEALQHDPRGTLDPSELEERAISLAATFVHAGYRAGFEVGLTVLGMDVPATPLRRSHWHVEKILGALAGLDLSRARTPVAARATADAERAGMVIIHPARIDTGIMRRDGWHFSAGQIEHLVLTRSVLAEGPTPLSTAAHPLHEEVAA